MIETLLTRRDFVLTLSLDDESGAFECECTPPNQAERQDVRKITRSWVSHIGRGRAHRLTGRVAKVKVIDTWLGCRCHGSSNDLPNECAVGVVVPKKFFAFVRFWWAS